MITGRIGEVIHEDFTVTDEDQNRIDGIDGDFTYHIFNPTGLEELAILVTIDELGYGHYRASFLPNQTGTWLLAVYHDTYFPWGKTGTIQVFTDDSSSIATTLKIIMGLGQNNYFVTDAVYDEFNNLTTSRVVLYEEGFTVGGATGILREYNMTAVYDENNNMSFYKTERI